MADNFMDDSPRVQGGDSVYASLGMSRADDHLFFLDSLAGPSREQKSRISDAAFHYLMSRECIGSNRPAGSDNALLQEFHLVGRLEQFVEQDLHLKNIHIKSCREFRLGEPRHTD